jgi:putative ABC transport system ATP-binding protein
MLSDKELSVTRGQRIGFIFQNFNLIRRSTAIANVEKPLVYQGKNRRQRRSIAMQVLQRVGLEDRANHFPSQLSGGQQQRVAIARALVTNPSILIADEPTGNLDLATGNSIINFLHELHAEGRTVVLVTHDPGLAKQAQRTIVLEDGKIKK